MGDGGVRELYRVRDLRVDVDGASVSRGGERIVLPPRTFELLVSLVRRAPCTVRRRELLEAVWCDEHVTDQTLSHRVMVLRKALGDHAGEPLYVAGERGFGYRLVAPVERVCPGPVAQGGARPRAPVRRRFLVALAVAPALLLAGLAIASRWRHPPALPRATLSLYEFLGREGARAPGVAGISPRVRRLCLRGELHWLSFTEDGLGRSAEAWETATKLAPGHAAAHAGWALTEGVRGLLGHRSAAEAEARARAESRRALDLDPSLPSARLAGSMVRLLFDWDAAGAAAEARTALETDPDDPRGPIVLALALQAQGRSEESRRLLEKASEDDPHSAAALFLAGRTHEMDGRWVEGALAFARALSQEPGLVAARRGRAECLAAARHATEALVALGDGHTRGDGVPGDTLREEWRRLCRSGGPGGETVRACVLGGDTERAARALAAAVEGRLPFVVFVPREALLRPLRDRPAFRAIREWRQPALTPAG